MESNMIITNCITILISLLALVISFCSLLKMKNQRRPYLSVSFDVKEKSLYLTNYGSVPAKLNEIEISPDDLGKLNAADSFGSLLSGKDADKPFKDLEGTVICPGLNYPFSVYTNTDEIKNNPCITITLKYGTVKNIRCIKSPYNESFKINLHTKTGHTTALFIKRNQQDNKSSI